MKEVFAAAPGSLEAIENEVGGGQVGSPGRYAGAFGCPHFWSARTLQCFAQSCSGCFAEANAAPALVQARHSVQNDQPTAAGENDVPTKVLEGVGWDGVGGWGAGWVEDRSS